MKKILHFSIALFCLLLAGTRASASHVAGGEIIYKWVSDSTYHVTFKFYRDCSSGTTAPVSQALCVRDTILNTSFSVNLLPSTTVFNQEVAHGCASFPTTCNGGMLPGFEEYWYEGNVTLPHRSKVWIFSTYINARNGSDNLNPLSNLNVFYVQATLNNLIAQGNSSPSFTVKPVVYLCLSEPYSYNNGAYDANGDSLGFQLIHPQTSTQACPGDVSDIPFLPSAPPFNLTTNPFSTNNTFVLDPTTGQFNLTPSLQGSFALTLLVTEYRNNVAIGSIMRDIQLHVLPCSIVAPTVNTDSTTIQITNGRIQDCAGHLLHFCFTATSPGAATKLVPSDNHAIVAPGSTITYTGIGTNTLYGCLDWIPANADSGFKIFTITVTDSTCAPPGITEANTFTLPLYIFPTTYTNPDTTICVGSSVNLAAHGGTTFNWTVLPGGSPISSLSCATCANTVATPTLTTTYVVTSNAVTGCSYIDSVTINVITPPAKPTPTSNSPLCANTTLNLFAGISANGYTWTGPAGFNATAQNPTVANIQVPNTGWYKVRASNGTCFSQPDSVYVTVTATPRMPDVTGNSPICTGGTLNLTAQSNTGAVYFWTGPANYHSGNQDAVIVNAGVQYSGTYSVTAAYPANTACKSAAATYVAEVKPGIYANFQFSRDSICQNDVVAITYNSGGADSLAWNLNGAVLQDTLGINPFHIAFPFSGTQYVTLVASDSACTDVVNRYIKVFPVPVATFTAPPVTCFGKPISIIANHDYSNDVLFSWNFGGLTVLSGGGQGPYAVQYNGPGTYFVTLSTQNTYCSSATTVDTLLVDALPDASFTSPDISNICAEDSLKFGAVAVPGSHYQWSPSQSFSYDTIPATYAQVRNTSYVYLNVTDQYGCKAADSLFLQPHPCCVVSFPNAFTPNGDAKNDVFRPITIGHHNVAYFTIVNRWGQLVFSSRNEAIGWDGKYKGVPQDPGTYFYTMKYQCADGGYFEEKGEVILMR